MALLREAKLFGHLIARLRPFLKDRLDGERAAAICRDGLGAREANFLAVVARAVFAEPGGVYRRLVDHAGIGLADIIELTRKEGLEGALSSLFDAGVHVTHDEFKGRVPIRRGSLVFEATTHDFDNPLAAKDFASRSGGSRSSGGRLFVDLDLLAHDAAYVHLQLLTFDLIGRSTFVWCSTPPFFSGISEILRLAKLGITPQRWFAQSVAGFAGRSWRHALLTRSLLDGCRLAGVAVPGPEKTPLGAAQVVAEAIAAAKRSGERPVLRANASSAVRVCTAALDAGIDIAGTVLRVSAEPFTPGKAEIVRKAGCSAAPWYAATEMGIIGLPCGQPTAVDDVHFMADKLALIRRDKDLGGGHTVAVNVYTSLVPTTPKLLFNVMSDDYCVLETRSCGCPLGTLGYATHMHTIRSHEKLTSEGMTFLGHDLIKLVEEVLPSRFGGTATDYQLVEEERDGLPKVDLLVSPRLGPLDEGEVLQTALDFLDHIPGAQIDFGDRWRQGGTLRVRRSEPVATGASKVLALHVAKPRDRLYMQN